MDEPRHRKQQQQDASAEEPRNVRLRPVEDSDDGTAVAPQRTIGRLIAQTALLADSALARRTAESDQRPRHRGRFGWFL